MGVASLAVVYLVLVLLYRRELASAGGRAEWTGAREALPEVRRGAMWLSGGAALGMLAAFALGVNVALAALAAAAVVLMGAGKRSGAMLRRVDYGLVVLFAALFVVVGAMADTGLPQRWLLAWLPRAGSALEVVGLTAAVTTLLSTVVSNVPAVLMLLPATGFADTVPAAANAWLGSPSLALTLAMASTLAGNLTLVASVANLIVAEGARRLGIELGFWTYLRAGLPVTLATLALGALWLAAGGL